jgi:lipopolysaccharide export system protein LptA
MTIERIRTLVLAAALLLLAALGAFLIKAKLKNVLNRRDLPQRLARNIQQEAKEFSFVHAYGAHSQFKIHASREVQLRDNRVQLHDVQIELYGEDGSRVDEISGDTFDYDQKSRLAIAEGPVEMVLTRPAALPAAGNKRKPGTSAGAAGQIHLKTSGVTFDQDTGLVATAKRVDFTMAQGSGSAVGATYDSQNGYLTLDHAVELTTHRGGKPVTVQALHAEFDRDAQICMLRGALVNYRGGKADAVQAKILFRADGTAQRLDVTGGFAAETATGGHLAAPTAQMDIDEHNQPRRGHLEGGVTLDSMNDGRSMQGTSPTADLQFTAQGQLRQAKLERGVQFRSEQSNQSTSERGDILRIIRTWRSPLAELNFHDTGKGQLELESLHGAGGVVVTSESQHSGAATLPSKMTADQVTGTFAAGSVLRSLTGVGHATIEQTTSTGARQTATGDRLEAEFAEAREGENGEQESMGARKQGSSEASSQGATEVQSAELDGHVVLFEQPAAKSRAPGDDSSSLGSSSGSQPQPPMHATAGRAVYEASGQWLHLTINPRVEYAGLQLTAQKVDISQQSGNAFAHGDVKATWINTPPPVSGNASRATTNEAGSGELTLGGSGPAHVVSADAELNESTGEAAFRGHARLWQLANSVSAPVIRLNQHLQTLTAQSSSPAEPVKAVLLSAGGPAAEFATASSPVHSATGNSGARAATPSVIRVRGGDLWYSEAERRAVMRSGAVGAVVVETGTATTSSDQVDLRLMPATTQEGESGGQTQVDRITATGHVALTSQGRKGSGEQLTFSSVTGEYVLTGTATAPPKMTDPARGTVTGEALIFHSHDDSVSIEGGGRETVTATSAPEVHAK